jgi:hypothetical protein
VRILRERRRIGLDLFGSRLLAFHLLLQRLNQFLKRADFLPQRLDFCASRRGDSIRGGRGFRCLSENVRRHGSDERQINKISQFQFLTGFGQSPNF